MVAIKDTTPFDHFKMICNSPSNIKTRHRNIIIDWFIDIAKDCNYKYDILIYAIVIMDRFFDSLKSKIDVEKYQLIASTAYIISIKMFHDGKVNDLIKKFENSEFSKKDILNMEKQFLQTISLNPLEFIKTFKHGQNFDIDFSIIKTIFDPI